MKWTKAELAYLAGVIDCDGTISMYKSKYEAKRSRSVHKLRFYVVNTRKELIDWLHDRFGGLVYSRKPKNENWRTKYEWMLENKQLGAVLPLLRPYIVIKREQLEVAIAFRKTVRFGRGYRIPNDVLAFRDECHQRMCSLNHPPLT